MRSRSGCPKIMKASNDLSTLVRGNSSDAIDVHMAKQATIAAGAMVNEASKCINEGMPHEL